MAEPTKAAGQCQVHLEETPAGWLLTITVDHQAAAELSAAVTQGHRVLRAGEMSVAITPNLVPGEPFEISAVQVVLTGDPVADQSGRGAADGRA